MRSIKPVEPSVRRDNPTHIPKALNNCTHVFVRVDKVRPSLHPRYNGPFEGVKRLRKGYVINVNGKSDTVSTDRLKPAFGILSVASGDKRVKSKTVRFE